LPNHSGIKWCHLGHWKIPEDEELAIEAIRKIEQESHTSGLTDRVTQLLKERKGKIEEKMEENMDE